MAKEIVIIGGGFAGINLARSFSTKDGFHITLVDRNNYNFFPPLLYQVATGFIEVSNISYPYRKLLHNKKHMSFRMGELLAVDAERKTVRLSTGEISYDYLVIATGTESNFFGMQNIKERAIPMKTVDDAIEMRNFLLQKSEEATLTKDADELRKLTTIVVAGGGPTGVEVAGMLAEMRDNILRKDYPELGEKKFRIVLVDGAPVLLTPMSKRSQDYTLDTLLKMGVEVKLNKQVKDYANDKVIFADGESIETKLLFWTAGVTSSVFPGIPESSFGRGRRIIVDEFNAVAGLKDVYAIGDTCFQVSDPAFPEGHPQLAQVAIQQGKNLAKNFKAMQEAKVLKPFRYHDRGSMAIIGRSKATADLPKPKMNFTGWFAWVMWLFVHLFSLINYRNRIKTMYNWTVSYFTRDQSLRMIIRPSEKTVK